MSKKQRLDKFLSNQGIGTRSEVKKFITKGFIQVNDEVAKNPATKVDPENDIIQYQGARVSYEEYVYLLLHKPAGVITATEDKFQKTVLDIIDHPKKKELFPVGRLDKDTEGLLLITNNGKLAHRLLSPKHHVDKKYVAKVDGRVLPRYIELFKTGVTLEDGYTCKSADLVIKTSESMESEVEITIREGKFHQIKRMFESIELSVTYLKRIEMGPIKLENDLLIGNFRALTDHEIEILNKV